MTPQNADLDIWAGNTWQKIFVFTEPADSTVLVALLETDDVVFRVTRNGTEILRKSKDDDQIEFVEVEQEPGTDVLAGALVVLTPAEARLIRNGALDDYEIEVRRDVVEVTSQYGKLVGKGGVNDDAA